MTHLADFAARLEQKLKEVEDDNVSLANQRDELLDALDRIGNQPHGQPEASHREVLEACVAIARAAIAKVRP